MTLIGQKFGDRYEIQREIGRGGMAQVYLALDTRLQRKVALKILAPQLALDTEFVRRFEREARVAAGLSHPAIVTVYDSDEHNGLLYITMEYIEGRSLYSILKEYGALEIGYAVSILGPLAQALDYAHRKGAVHRDVKPHNVLVATDGRVLLADFGIVLPPDADRERLTRTGIFMGTPEYVSPEQLEAQQVDGASDRYSLGIVAYEILTGRVPFSGTTAQLLLAHTQLPPPPLRKIAPNLPADLESIFERALAKRPHNRFRSGEEFVQEIARIMKRQNIPQATTAQIAMLAKPHDDPLKPRPIPSSDPTPASPSPPPILAQPGAVGPRASTVGPRPEASVPPPPVSPPVASISPRPEGDDRTSGTSGNPTHHPNQVNSSQPDRKRIPAGVWLLLLLLLIGSVIALYVLFPKRSGEAMNPTPTNEPTATMYQVIATDTPIYVMATNTPIIELATNTPEPTSTDTPQPIPTDTPQPMPTNTPQPIPTDTPQPIPTDTPQPIPTDTPIPPEPTAPPPEPTQPPPEPTQPPTEESYP